MTHEQLEAMAERVFLLLLLHALMDDMAGIDWHSPLFNSLFDLDTAEYDIVRDMLQKKVDEEILELTA